MKKAGRNDACPCGSGKKYKQCCLQQDDLRASEARPPVIDSGQSLQAAAAHYRAGRAAEAEQLCRTILAAEPKHAGALHLFGMLAGDRGDCTTAIDAIRKAIALDKNQHSYHANLGRMYSSQDQHTEAEACYRRAAALKPDCAHLDNLGNALRAQNKFAAAETHYRRALTLNPNFAAAYRSLGDLLQLQEQYAEAIGHYQQALVLNPDFAEVHSNLGALLKRQGHAAEATTHYRQALALNPNFAQAHSNLGAALQATGDLDGAIECFGNALALETDYTKHSGARDADIDIQHSVEDTLLYIMGINANCAPSDYLQAACRYGAKLAAVAQPYTLWPNVSNNDGQTLRIGLLSADLRHHPVGFFLENMLAHLDPSKIQLIAYPTVAEEDALTQRIKPYFAHWHSLVGLSNRQCAQKVYADAPHILIDLGGLNANNRLPVFAWKPAPVQVNWLGYWASTGLAAVDYILGDPYSIPAQDCTHFCERPWRLPATRLCFTPPQEAVSCAELPASTNGYITFGCFNNPSKMNDAVVVLWAQILQRVPNSRLTLKAKLFEDASVVAAISERFAAQGIAAQRLNLLGASPRAEYLAAFNDIDIALDPFPYTGGTTSVEGLWMGVPLLTRRGDRLVARQGESILHNIGLVDWIADDDDEYVERAVAHAADLQRLAQLRSELRARLLASPLCDAESFARHFEAALIGMWEEYSNNNLH